MKIGFRTPPRGDWGLLPDGTDTTNNGLIGFPYLPEVNEGFLRLKEVFQLHQGLFPPR